MAKIQDALTAFKNLPVTVYHNGARTMGVLIDDGSGAAQDSIVLRPIPAGADITIPKSTISGISG
jgi:hypothetical protein